MLLDPRHIPQELAYDSVVAAGDLELDDDQPVLCVYAQNVNETTADWELDTRDAFFLVELQPRFDDQEVLRQESLEVAFVCELARCGWNLFVLFISRRSGGVELGVDRRRVSRRVIESKMAAIDLEQDILVGLRAVVDPTRRVGRESEQMRRDRSLLDLRIALGEPGDRLTPGEDLSILGGKFSEHLLK